MKAEAEANAEADKAEREMVDKLNSADSLIFQTEKQIKEFDDKLTAEDKTQLNADLDELKKAHSDKDVQRIDESTNKLTQTWNTISTKLYEQSQTTEEPTNTTSGNDEVDDVDFEEVK